MNDIDMYILGIGLGFLTFGILKTICMILNEAYINYRNKKLEKKYPSDKSVGVVYSVSSFNFLKDYPNRSGNRPLE